MVDFTYIYDICFYTLYFSLFLIAHHSLWFPTLDELQIKSPHHYMCMRTFCSTLWYAYVKISRNLYLRKKRSSASVINYKEEFNTEEQHVLQCATSAASLRVLHAAGERLAVSWPLITSWLMELFVGPALCFRSTTLFTVWILHKQIH